MLTFEYALHLRLDKVKKELRVKYIPILAYNLQITACFVKLTRNSFMFLRYYLLITWPPITHFASWRITLALKRIRLCQGRNGKKWETTVKLLRGCGMDDHPRSEQNRENVKIE